jgi:arginase family enzyme
MTDLELFFKPVDRERIEFVSTDAMRIGNKVRVHTAGQFPDLEGVKVALVGIEEQRNAVNNKGCDLAADAVRKQFFRLFASDKMPITADLGTLISGNSVSDTYFLLAEILAKLIQHNIIPILVGGSQDITYANYMAYERLEQAVNIVSIDSRFDIGKAEQELNAETYIGKIILKQPNYLFNYSNIGYQTYFVDHHDAALMDELFFDRYRLGLAKNNIMNCEPIIRNSDIFSLDMSALSFACSPGCKQASPNGFNGVEICQLAYYAGISNKITSFGLYEYNPLYDIANQSAMLCAQILWHFLDGIMDRTDDQPNVAPHNYLKYYVALHDNIYQIVFYKHKINGLWWMEVPMDAKDHVKFRRHYLVPCSQKDYQIACQNEVPDRWLQTFNKIKH